MCAWSARQRRAAVSTSVLRTVSRSTEERLMILSTSAGCGGVGRKWRVYPEIRARGRNVVTRSEIVLLPIPQIHRAKRRPTDTRGIFEHRAKHRLEFARGRTDDLQHLGRCGLLLQGFAQ